MCEVMPVRNPEGNDAFRTDAAGLSLAICLMRRQSVRNRILPCAFSPIEGCAGLLECRSECF
jgi:hypothetical protein